MVWVVDDGTVDGGETGIQYYISSLPVDAQQVAQGIWRHWEVENKAHWVPDVAFRKVAAKSALYCFLTALLLLLPHTITNCCHDQKTVARDAG